VGNEEKGFKHERGLVPEMVGSAKNKKKKKRGAEAARGGASRKHLSSAKLTLKRGLLGVTGKQSRARKDLTTRKEFTG